MRPQWHHSSWGLEAPGLRKCVAIQADSLLSLQAPAHRYGAEMLKITTLTALWAFTGEGTLQKVIPVFNIDTLLLQITLLQSQWFLIFSYINLPFFWCIYVMTNTNLTINLSFGLEKSPKFQLCSAECAGCYMMYGAIASALQTQTSRIRSCHWIRNRNIIRTI